VVENKTGLFFEHQTVESLIQCIEDFEKRSNEFIPQDIRKHAENFKEERFRTEIKKFVDKKFSEFNPN
jgi:hypothetical protein